MNKKETKYYWESKMEKKLPQKQKNSPPKKAVLPVQKVVCEKRLQAKTTKQITKQTPQKKVLKKMIKLTFPKRKANKEEEIRENRKMMMITA